jgi:hypothetical protein
VEEVEGRRWSEGGREEKEGEEEEEDSPPTCQWTMSIKKSKGKMRTRRRRRRIKEKIGGQGEQGGALTRIPTLTKHPSKTILLIQIF